MAWGAALMGALKALPELASIGRELVDVYKGAKKSAIEKKYEKLREEVNELTTKVEKASSDEERRNLVRKLNSAISR